MKFPFDKLIARLVALGIPALVLIAAIASTGLAGGAAIVAALAMLGGPFGMMGGVLVLISAVLLLTLRIALSWQRSPSNTSPSLFGLSSSR